MKKGGTKLGRGVGEIVVVGLGHNGGCKDRSECGGVFRDEERGGQEGWKGKKPKEYGKGNGDGQNPRKGWSGGGGRGAGREGKKPSSKEILRLCLFAVVMDELTYLKSFSSKAWRAVIAFIIKLQSGNMEWINMLLFTTRTE